MRLFTGTILRGYIYSLIVEETRVTEENDNLVRHYEARIVVAEKSSGIVVHSFDRMFSSKWGNWTHDGIKHSMLTEVREDMS